MPPPGGAAGRASAGAACTHNPVAASLRSCALAPPAPAKLPLPPPCAAGAARDGGADGVPQAGAGAGQRRRSSERRPCAGGAPFPVPQTQASPRVQPNVAGWAGSAQALCMRAAGAAPRRQLTCWPCDSPAAMGVFPCHLPFLLQQEHTARVMAVWKKYKCNPMKSLLGMFVQAPIFIGFFTGLRAMAAAKVSGAARLLRQPRALPPAGPPTAAVGSPASCVALQQAATYMVAQQAVRCMPAGLGGRWQGRPTGPSAHHGARLCPIHRWAAAALAPDAQHNSAWVPRSPRHRPVRRSPRSPRAALCGSPT